MKNMFLAGTILAFLSASASATVVTNGSTVAPSLTNTVDFGATLASLPTQTLTTALYSLNYNTSVVQSLTGGLYFLHQFSSSPNSITSIEGVAMVNYAGFVTDVQADANGGTQAAATVSRGGTGVDLNWDFTGAVVGPGMMSYRMAVYVPNATGYTSGMSSFQDGLSINAESFAPTAVPESSTFALAALGLAAAGFIRKKRA
jgi:hypothetical protein